MPDRAVEVVGTIGQRGLSRSDAQHDPVSLDMRNVVKHQPANGNGSQVHQGRRFFDVGQAGIFRMECERNKGLKTARFILQLPQADQVVDPVEWFFDMPI